MRCRRKNEENARRGSRWRRYGRAAALAIRSVVSMDPARQDEATLPDAHATHPIWRYAPQTARPYVQLARLDRPIGWWLLLLPCWEGSLLASSAKHIGPNYFHLLLFLIGAIAMRGAGSTYNDYVDREIDAKVERTKKRPLACGDRKSTRLNSSHT